MPDGNYCAFVRYGATPALFNDMAERLFADYREDWSEAGVLPPFAMEPYDSVHLLAQAMDIADSYDDGAAVVAALETIDTVVSQGRYYFDYGIAQPRLAGRHADLYVASMARPDCRDYAIFRAGIRTRWMPL